MDREVWRAAIHGVAKSWTRLSDWTELNWWSHCHLLCCFGFNFINVFYVSHLEKSFSICWRAGLVVLNSLSFCLPVKLLISPSYLIEILAGYSILGCRFFSFITLSMSCHSLLAWRVSVERSAAILMGIPSCVFCCFSLAAFNICSLCLIFVLINMCLGVFCLGFILFGIFWVSWTWMTSPF